ncbi:Glucose-6-phosphate 1-dehydrogenase [Aquisphaera giovannonii]|uniref:Glucose-6-phosphate 1-dehydrogenase n=1 Tax=Aquisphaera giovannonii TaxID=406548 RepID=A0A5B9W1Q4_9BACT|nr:glucose-6-phosphate dehydrogenase [Aquisphaera giovannonii]QEH34199.1 Glucose-6-phosphate 1-dehydrogenase [Aquisphaera giovannonii]
MPAKANEPAADSNPLRQSLPRARVPEPCAVVLFGSTGDLAHRKLVPALYNLARGGNLPSECAIVGFARRDWSDDDLRAEYEKTLEKEGGPDFKEIWPQFSTRLVFSPGNFDDPESYRKLKEKLEELDRTHGTRGNRIFYLAVSPEFFETIVEQLGKAGLIYPRHQESPWSRVVIEKPFGHDLGSAKELSRDLSKVLDESQVYRIDHYLGKETVQNILAFRFGNSIFEPIWNRRHVGAVQITVAEEVGMSGSRGAYYDTAGAIRDMVQNHMMQLLCLVAMEPPTDLSADVVRSEKVKVLQALPRWKPEDVYRNVVRAQYTAGSIEGKEVPGYLQEKGVKPDSRTAPYVAMRLELNNWRWAGVPFFLRTGKRLPKRATEIAIQFRRPPTELFEPEVDGHTGMNQLVLRIQPNEGASLAFEAKIPGSRRRLQEVRMDFRYGTAFAVPPPEAYERLLLDVMLGDPTLFTRTDEVDSAWRFITTILDAWELPDAPPPVNYVAGSWGPLEADKLLEADGSKWRRL